MAPAVPVTPENGHANGHDAPVATDTPLYYGAGDVEKAGGAPVARFITPGGHPVDFSQPAIPVQHRKFGNPLPAGLFSFGMGLMLMGLYTVGARGVTRPHAGFPMLVMFLGITQTLVGWFEMFLGNTFSATIFICYGGFIWSFPMMFGNELGTMTAFTVEGAVLPEFNQAVGLYCILWAVLSFFFVLAALRSSVAVLGTLFFVTIMFACMAAQFMTGTDGARLATGAFQIIAGVFGFWAALAGYWTPDVTYAFIRAPPINLAPGA